MSCHGEKGKTKKRLLLHAETATYSAAAPQAAVPVSTRPC